MPLDILGGIQDAGPSLLPAEHGDGLLLNPWLGGSRTFQRLFTGMERCTSDHASSFLGTQPDCGELQVSKSRLSRTPVSFTQGHQTPGVTGKMKAGPALDSKEKMNEAEGKPEGDFGGKGEPFEWDTRMGKTVLLCSDDVKCCEKSCLEDPQLKDANPPLESAGTAGVEKLESDPGKPDDGNAFAINTEECIKYCKAQFTCFPGDSKVIVRGSGPVTLAELSVGDSILAIRQREGLPSQCSGEGSSALSWELHFDPVVAWLHHEPDAEEEFIRIRHSLGQIHLSDTHLIFVQRAGGSSRLAAPVLANQVQIGDRVLAPWIDGSVSAPEVQAVQRVQKKGLYAPLLSGGTVIVDGTAASCYAIPPSIWSSPLYAGLRRLLDASAMQALYHAIFAPLRLACHVSKRAPLPGLSGLVLGPGAAACHCDGTPGESKIVKSEVPTIHPYGWVLYVIWQSAHQALACDEEGLQSKRCRFLGSAAKLEKPARV